MKQKKRYDTILLYKQGFEREQIAEILHIPHRIVWTDIASYQKERIDALLLIERPRASRKLSDEQEYILIHIISVQTSEEERVGIFVNRTSFLALYTCKRELVWYLAIKECATV